VLNGETHRKLALHCPRVADKVRDPGMHLALLSLAATYMALAHYADHRREHGAAHPATKTGIIRLKPRLQGIVSGRRSGF